jgi:hypothetical protein
VVPQLIRPIVQHLLVRGRHDAACLVEIGQHDDLAAGALCTCARGLERPEALAERDLRRVVDDLVGKDQDRVAFECVTDLLEIRLGHVA